MTIEKCSGNFNFMYKFRLGESFFPCHIISNQGEYVHIFTQTGTITRELKSCVRKMDKKEYLESRNFDIRSLGEFAYNHGYHHVEADDLNLFEESNELEMDTDKVVLTGSEK